MGWYVMKRYVIEFAEGKSVELFTPHIDWRTSFYTMVTQIPDVRNGVEYVKVLSLDDETPAELLPNEWERMGYEGKKIVLDYDLKIIHNEFEEGNVWNEKHK